MSRVAYVTEHEPCWVDYVWRLEIPDDAPADEAELKAWVMEKIHKDDDAGEDAIIAVSPATIRDHVDGLDSAWEEPDIEEER
jgi:subtilisin-like proprotein convertase family protein